MTEVSAPATDASAQLEIDPPSARRVLDIRLQVFKITLAIEVLAFGLLLWRLLAGDASGLPRLPEITLWVVAVVATFWNVVHRERVWRGALSRLTGTIQQIRAGERPMDCLKIADGKLATIATEVHSLIQELRRQRGEVAGLEAEVRQKVANRTNALERTIGSLRQQATRDALTGLFNRRMLDQHLPLAIERCAATGAALALLMIDVDHFKLLNDTRGHAAGDELLRCIGQIIRSTLRDGDVAFRYGGDEFAVVIEGPSASSADALAQRLISLVDSLARTLHVSPPPRLSIGVASLGEPGSATAQELVEGADKRLYELKASRRIAGEALRSGRGAVQSSASFR